MKYMLFSHKFVILHLKKNIPHRKAIWIHADVFPFFKKPKTLEVFTTKLFFPKNRRDSSVVSSQTIGVRFPSGAALDLRHSD